jgi:hypothetical protein
MLSHTVLSRKCMPVPPRPHEIISYQHLILNSGRISSKSVSLEWGAICRQYNNGKLARPARFELAAKWFEATYSIQLSYGRLKKYLYAVIPAKAGIYCMDPRLRGDDKIALTYANLLLIFLASNPGETDSK